MWESKFLIIDEIFSDCKSHRADPEMGGFFTDAN